MASMYVTLEFRLKEIEGIIDIKLLAQKRGGHAGVITTIEGVVNDWKGKPLSSIQLSTIKKKRDQLRDAATLYNAIMERIEEFAGIISQDFSQDKIKAEGVLAKAEKIMEEIECYLEGRSLLSRVSRIKESIENLEKSKYMDVPAVKDKMQQIGDQLDLWTTERVREVHRFDR